MVAAKDLVSAGPAEVTVVDGVALPSGTLRPGAYVFLAPLSGELPFEARGEVEDPLVWRTVPNHPVLDGLDLSHAFARRAWSLGGAGFEPLAFAEGAAVAGEGERLGVRYVVLGVDPEESTLPVRAAFPLFLRNAVRRLAVAPAAALRPAYLPGERVRARTPLPEGDAPRLVLVPFAEGAATELGAVRLGEGEGLVAPEGPGGWLRAGEPGSERTVTALLGLDERRAVAPEGPESAWPAAAAASVARADRLQALLCALAALLLLLDLFLLGALRRREGALLAPRPA
jgi:hypothetical protein